MASVQAPPTDENKEALQHQIPSAQTYISILASNIMTYRL